MLGIQPFCLRRMGSAVGGGVAARLLRAGVRPAAAARVLKRRRLRAVMCGLDGGRDEGGGSPGEVDQPGCVRRIASTLRRLWCRGDVRDDVFFTGGDAG